MSQATKRRRAARDEPARERILAAALEVFAERGFEGARTRDIAQRAGANLGLLQYYFGAKEALWRAAVTHAFDELAAELDAIRADAEDDVPDDVRAQLERFLRGFVRFLARRPAFMRLMNDECRRDSPRMRWLANHHVRRPAAALAEMLALARAKGIFPEVPPASFHYIVLGAAGLFFSQAPECQYLRGVDPTDEAVADAHADALVRLLLGPARA